MSRSKIILRTLTTILVVIVVLLAFSVSLIRIFGFEVYGVLTGSMEPKYPVGSLIYVKEINTDKLEVGDAISFKLTENVIATHRIVEILPSEAVPGAMSYRTKGDANDVVDSSLVEESEIIGKVVFCIPKMGYVLDYIQSPSGIVTTIIVSIVLVGLVFISELITSDSEMLWRIRCAITGESGKRPADRRPQQRRMSSYDDDPRKRRQAPEPRQAQRSRAPRYDYDDYGEPRRTSRPASSSRYDDYGEPRRSTRPASSSRYDDYGEPRRSTRSASSSRYDDYGEPRRSTRSASSSRYDDYGEPRRSTRSASSSRYDDYGEPRRSTRSASSSRYDDYGEPRRSTRSASSSRYDDYGEPRRSTRSASSSQESYRQRSYSSDEDYR